MQFSNNHNKTPSKEYQFPRPCGPGSQFGCPKRSRHVDNENNKQTATTLPATRPKSKCSVERTPDFLPTTTTTTTFCFILYLSHICNGKNNLVCSKITYHSSCSPFNFVSHHMIETMLGLRRGRPGRLTVCPSVWLPGRQSSQRSDTDEIGNKLTQRCKLIGFSSSMISTGASASLGGENGSTGPGERVNIGEGLSERPQRGPSLSKYRWGLNHPSWATKSLRFSYRPHFSCRARLVQPY